MNSIRINSWFVLLLVLVFAALLNGCSKQELHTEKDFVGKWQSSRVTTPVYLYENGEWELKADDGTVMQYGVWQYFDNKIMWSVRAEDQVNISHDVNAILSASPREFQLREKDNSITTFTKLD